MMYIQLLSIQRFDIQGEQRTFYPGDWVDVGKQTAMRLVQSGQARIPSPQARKELQETPGALTVTEYKIAAERTAIVRLETKPETITLGLSLLDTWQIAVPLQNYKTLAAHIGTDDERAKAAKVLPDLRVPLYDTRLMFVKDTDETRLLFERWAKYDYSDLGFLMALYKTPLLILALPTTWIEAKP